MRCSPPRRTPLRLAGLVTMVGLVAACSGGDDGDISSGEPTPSSTPSGEADDGDATISFTSARLVWGLDGEPVGDELSYAEPIERDRFEAGLRWELRFDVVGDVVDVNVVNAPGVIVNDDRIESGGAEIGPERGVLFVQGEFEAVIEGGEVVVGVDVGRPVSAASLDDERRRFEELTGIDPDAEQVDVGDDMVLNVDVLVDLPPSAGGTVNRYEYTFNGELLVLSGPPVALDTSTELLVRDAPDVGLDLGADCAGLVEQYAEQVDVQLASPGLVLVDRMQAMTALGRAADERGCEPIEFELAACAAATTLVAESGGDDTLPPWSEATIICPQGFQLEEATVIEASNVDGVLDLVVPATNDGLPALAVALATPDWEVTVNPPRSNGQEVEFDAPGASGFREAWFEVSTSDMPASLLDERFGEAVTAGEPGAREAGRATGEIDGRRWEWYAAASGPDYEFGAAVVLDEERLLRVRGSVTADDGRAPTDDSVTELVRCMTESVAVEAWSVAADHPEPSASCLATGDVTASTDESGDTDADADADADAGANDVDVAEPEADPEPDPAGPSAAVVDGLRPTKRAPSPSPCRRPVATRPVS